MIPVIETLDLLKELSSNQEGDRFWVVEENCAYIFTNGEWIQEEENKNIEIGTLYDINKGIISQLKGLTPENWMKAYDLLRDFIKSKNDKYFMMLSHELRYYTLFVHTGAEQPIELAVGDCLRHWVVKSIELTEDGNAVEIWADVPDLGAVVFYFFPYDLGVCECA